MIYLASPYSSPIPEGMQMRFEKTRLFTAYLLRQDIFAFSPIVYAHEMSKALNLGTDAKSWLRFNFNMLRRSEAMFVYMLPGWRDSKGVKIELKLARSLFMPITFFNEDFTPAETEA